MSCFLGISISGTLLPPKAFPLVILVGGWHTGISLSCSQGLLGQKRDHVWGTRGLWKLKWGHGLEQIIFHYQYYLHLSEMQSDNLNRHMNSQIDNLLWKEILGWSAGGCVA